MRKDMNEYFPAAPSTIETQKIALRIGDELVPYDRLLELVRNSGPIEPLDTIESEKTYTKDEVIDLLIDISVGCPRCGLGCNDGFLKDNCRMPNCKPDRDEKECWRKWLEYREENPDE